MTSRDWWQRWEDTVATCDHAHQPYTSEFRGRTFTYCHDCADVARDFADAARAAAKAERKAQLDAMPRCDLCNRRGTWRYPYGVLVCGWHKRKLKAGWAASDAHGGIVAMLSPPTRDDLIRWAKGGA